MGQKESEEKDVMTQIRVRSFQLRLLFWLILSVMQATIAVAREPVSAYPAVRDLMDQVNMNELSVAGLRVCNKPLSADELIKLTFALPKMRGKQLDEEHFMARVRAIEASSTMGSSPSTDECNRVFKQADVAELLTLRMLRGLAPIEE